MKRQYATAKIVMADRIILNIEVGVYGSIVSVDFMKRIVWIKWVGTRKDHDKIDVKEVEYEKP